MDDNEDTFKLSVRSGSSTAVTITVRPTTTCGAIVAAFLKRAGLTSTKRPKLMIDGDKMNPETPISEADLEDGDLVEVVDM